MKRLLVLLLSLSFALGLLSVSANAASTEGTAAKPLDLYESEYFYTDADGMPESPHSYPHNMDKSWYIIREGATSISVTFSEDTKTEGSFDELYIFDKDGNQIGCYYNTELAGRTVTVSGDRVQIRLTSDSSVAYYGFKVTDISYLLAEESFEESSEESYEEEAPYYDCCPYELLPESEHDYSNNTYDTWTLSCNGASYIKLCFSSDTWTESYYDRISIYDGSDTLIGEYDGTALSGVTVTVYGDTAKITLSTDGSVRHYGFSLDEATAYFYDYDAYLYSYWSLESPYGDFYESVESVEESSERTVTLTVLDWDGSLLGEVEVNAGEILSSLPFEPVRERHIFLGWDADELCFYEDTVVTAVYSPTVYCVSFMDWDGTELESVYVYEYTAASYSGVPYRDGYIFVGWSEDISYITEDLAVTAVYEEATEPEAYTVVFMDYDGSVISETEVSEGDNVTAPADPERVGYRFIGWSASLENITEDTTVTALYERTYLVGDANLDGIVNSLDAAAVLKYDAALLDLSDLAWLCADANWNGEVNSLDAAMILKYDADLLAQLPQCPIYNLSAGGNYFLGNQNVNINFTVSAGIYYEGIELYDESDNLLGIMKDDGLGADARANDGIYTLNTTVYYSVNDVSADISFYCKSGEDRSETLTLTFLSNEYGSLSGVVKNASDRSTSIERASVAVYMGEVLYTTAYSNNEGQYSFTLPDGNYKIIVSADGYISLTTYASIENGYDTYLETFLMAEITGARTGVASGVIKNSLTGEKEADVELRFVKDWNNYDSTNYMDVNVVTDGVGAYSVELPLGNYSVIAEKDGFITAYFNIVVFDGVADNQDGVITPVIEDGVAGGSYLITLTWGSLPTDLDSHVQGTSSGGYSFHVYFSDKSHREGDTEVCNLDYDDTSSYGPEHITLVPTTADAYYYYVYQYSSSGTLAASEARVTVECDNRVIASFNVPTDQGNGRYWNIFAIKDGELIIENTVTDSVDVYYAD